MRPTIIVCVTEFVEHMVIMSGITRGNQSDISTFLIEVVGTTYLIMAGTLVLILTSVMPGS